MKILYMIVLPSHSVECVKAIKECSYIGCSTQQDWDHCTQYGALGKAVRVRHGITLSNCLGQTGFKQKHNITKNMFLSCGGYWPNKAMKELSLVFGAANVPDSVLVTTGYDNRMNLMPQPSTNVIPMLIDDRSELLSAIKDADCLLMHSYTEGFGLVLLEAMVNNTPWIARDIAGANQLKEYGLTYNSDVGIINLLQTFNKSKFNLDSAYNYAVNNHLIGNTVDDIEKVVRL